MDDRWRHFFLRNDLDPLVLIYEQIVRDNRSAVESIYAYLGMSVTNDLVVKTDRVKMADNVTDELTKKYQTSNRFVRWGFHHVARNHVRFKDFIQEPFS